MRTLLVAALLLVIFLPAVNAQAETAILDLQVKAPTDPIGSEGAQVDVTVTRICQNTLMYVPDQLIRLEIRGPPGSVVDGPESVRFPAHPCAVQSVDERSVTYTVKVPSDAPAGMTFIYSVEAQPAQGDQVFGAPEPVEADFHLATPPADPDAAAVDEVVTDGNVTADDVADAAQDLQEASESGEVMDIPGPSWLVAVLGLGLVALRRRIA